MTGSPQRASATSLLWVGCGSWATQPAILRWKAVLARGVPRRRSLASAIIAPAPAHTPSMAATMGCGQARMALTSAPVMRVNASNSGMVIFVSGPTCIIVLLIFFLSIELPKFYDYDNTVLPPAGTMVLYIGAATLMASAYDIVHNQFVKLTSAMNMAIMAKRVDTVRLLLDSQADALRSAGDEERRQRSEQQREMLHAQRIEEQQEVMQRLSARVASLKKAELGAKRYKAWQKTAGGKAMAAVRAQHAHLTHGGPFAPASSFAC